MNCSFSANTIFDANDPVNVATRMLTDHGINVVFSAGNTGPGLHTLNPYAVAPWVISVGATDTPGHLASFSSRGDFASGLFHPTLVAPGVNVVSLRGSGIANVTGAEGLAGADTQRLNGSELPYYTTSSGTSFFTPQWPCAIELYLKPSLISPRRNEGHLAAYRYAAGSLLPTRVAPGMLNVHAAVCRLLFPERSWDLVAARSIVDRCNSSMIRHHLSGVAQPGGAPHQVSDSEQCAGSVQISWGPLSSLNDWVEVYDSHWPA